MTRPVGIGLVGPGMWRIAAAATRTQGVYLVSCFGRNEDARRETAAHLGCRPAESIEALLDDPGVEGVLGHPRDPRSRRVGRGRSDREGRR